MSSYPPAGDYDERLLDNAPKATRAEKQEGYNVNLLASDNSESPMNARPLPTVDGHTSLETGVPPTKEGYISSYPVPWHRQKKWRVFILIGGIIFIGAIAGGVAGGVISSKNKSDSPNNGTGPSTVSIPTSTGSSTFIAPAGSTGAPPPGSSLPPDSTTGAGAVPTGSGDPPTSSIGLGGNDANGFADAGIVVSPVVARSN